jgi:hypothetical protein
VASLETVCAQLRADVTLGEQLNHELQERAGTLAADRHTQDDRMARAARKGERTQTRRTASLSQCAQLKREYAAASHSAKKREVALRATVEQLQRRLTAAEAQHADAVVVAAATQHRRSWLTR